MAAVQKANAKPPNPFNEFPFSAAWDIQSQARLLPNYFVETRYTAPGKIII
jgi:hypothetical protein